MGPALVGSPGSPLAELAQDPHGGQARDGHRLASKKIPVLLELEEPPGTDGTTGSVRVTNAAYNGSLGAGQATSFGFQANGTGTGTTATCTPV